MKRSPIFPRFPLSIPSKRQNDFSMIYGPLMLSLQKRLYRSQAPSQAVPEGPKKPRFKKDIK
jgi:hypothetical protein